MFRPMRRIKQLLPEKEVIEILERNTSGVLSLLGDGGYPYGVPLSYVYIDNKIYFHCAATGHKIDAIKGYNKASFTVIDRDDILPEKFATNYNSIIAFGKITIVEDNNEKLESIKALAKKYSPLETEESVNHEINSSLNSLCMLRFDIEHITGKEGLYLNKMRNNK